MNELAKYGLFGEEDDSNTKSVAVRKVWEGNGDSFNNRPDYVQVKLTAADGSDIYYSDGTPVDSLILFSDNSWTAEWENIPSDITCTVKEVNVPDGYKASVSGSDTDGFTVTNTKKKNETIYDTLKVNKKDESGKELENAVFTIYSDEDCTNEVTTVNGNESVDLSKVISFVSPKINGEDTTLYLKETKAPTGYKADETVYNLTLAAEETSDYVTVDYITSYVTTTTYSLIYQGESEITVTNKPKETTTESYGRFTVNKTDENGTKLDGSKFTIYEDENCETEVTTVDGNKSVSLGSNAFSKYLKSGKDTTLYLKETTAPTGYKADTTVYPLTLKTASSQSGYVTTLTHTMTYNGVSNITIKNERNEKTNENYSDFTVNKTDESGSELDGAVFTIYADENCKTAITTVDGNEDVDLSADAFEEYLPDADEDTTLYLKETTAPDGYNADTTAYPLTLATKASSGWNSDHTAYVTDKTYTMTYKGDSEITVENERNDTTDKGYANFTVNKTDGSGNKLDGAVFTIYADENCETAVTTVNGNESVDLSASAFKNYLPDAGENTTLYLKETTTPDGYNADTEVYPLTLAAEETSAWNSGHTAYVTTTAYSMTYNGESEITVVNEKITSGTTTQGNTSGSQQAGSQQTNGTSSSGSGPATEDQTNMLLLIIIIIAAAAGIISLAAIRHRRS
ncbi:MAG: SpaA isopeptide-forming pilin-related protein [Anaerovoracaceae bacterium]